MNDLQTTLFRLTQNLALLQKREAKYACNALPGLLNQIEDDLSPTPAPKFSWICVVLALPL
jgi:hypothetical protein